MPRDCTAADCMHSWMWIARQQQPLVVNDEWTRWPSQALAALERDGLLQPGPPSDVITCCPIADIVWPSEDFLDRRPRACCPVCGPYPVEPETLSQKRANREALPRWLSRQLQLAGEPESLVCDHLWRLGRCNLGGRTAVVYLARRIDYVRPDSPVGQSLSSPAAVVVSLGPIARDWNKVAHAELASIVDWNGESFVCERDAIEALLPPRPKAVKAKVVRDVDRVATAIRKEIIRHLKDCVHHVRAQLDAGQPPTILPELTHPRLAKLCRTSESSIYRRLKESKELRGLLMQSGNLERVLELVAKGKLLRPSTSASKKVKEFRSDCVREVSDW